MTKNSLFLLGFFCLSLVNVTAQTTSSDKLHTISRYAKTADISSITALENATLEDASVSVTYFDDFNRPDQSIALGVSPNGNNLVSFQEYNDAIGGLREVSYLPYVSNTANATFIDNPQTQQASFYSTATHVGHDTKPWSKVEYEKSPAKRILRAGGMGDGYQLDQGYETTYSYDLSTGVDQVLKWDISDQGALLIPHSLYWYGLHTLYKNVVSDEDFNQTIVFTNHLGQKILSRYITRNDDFSEAHRFDTYYVYDDLGNLRFMIPPEASKNAANGDPNANDDDHLFTVTQEDLPETTVLDEDYFYTTNAKIKIQANKRFLPGFSIRAHEEEGTEEASEEFDKHIFSYEYNSLNHLISKKEPGAQAVYYVYDKSGRLILSQDGNQRVDDKWTFTKYDRYNRPILTGEVVDSRSRASLETHVWSTITTGTNRYEKRGASFHGYTNTVWPTNVSVNHYLVVSYYDDYDFMDGTWSAFSYESVGGVYDAEPMTSPYGLETGGKIKILGTSNWLNSAKYYDDEYMLIYVVAKHHRGRLDKIYGLYDEWDGSLLQSKFMHQVDGTKTITVDERYTYDDTGRLLAQYHSVDGETEYLIAEYHYNELGELIEKNLHQLPSAENAFVQSIDYRYNIRGQLTHINQAARTTLTGDVDDNQDRFGMELHYDSSPAGLTFDEQTNGLLAGVTWGTSNIEGAASQRSFSYAYDKVNRITGASYLEGDGTAWNTKLGYHNVSNITYDLNGNIKTLDRKADNQTIDDLSYTYDVNQLKRVNDATNHKDGVMDASETFKEYTYDANGNMIADANKLIESISYNLLNKPEVITFTNGDHIDYRYDAGGARLSMAVYTGDETFVTDYCGGIIYEDDEPDLLAMPQGRIAIDVVSNDYSYDYQYVLSDHLGNTRSIVAPAVRTYIATMETNVSGLEEAQFLNLEESRSGNEANSGSNSARLNPKYGDIVGPAKALKVYAGELVELSVDAKYEDLASYSQNGVNAILFDAITSAFGLSSGEAFSALSSQLTGSSLIAQSPGDEPAAHINYILFDKNYNVIDSGFEPIDEGSKGAFKSYALSIPIAQEGYLYTYLSNESSLDVDVYFDDFTIVHTSEATVLHTEDYYPFGLPIASSVFKEIGQDENRFKYQGKEWQTALALNLYDFHARQYDPATGRFTGVDPKGQFASGYVGMGNNPTMGVDPDGEWVHILVGAIVGSAAAVVTNWGEITGGSFTEGFWAFQKHSHIGGAIGAAAAFTGGAATAGVTGGTVISGGAVAASGASTASVGFGAGFVAGAAGGVAGGFVGGAGNAWAYGASFQGGLRAGSYGALIGGATGGLTGGLDGGIRALKSGGNFWSGNVTDNSMHNYTVRASKRYRRSMRNFASGDMLAIGGGGTHIVAKYETLYGIANRTYGITVEQLLKMNPGLDENAVLIPGQVLNIGPVQNVSSSSASIFRSLMNLEIDYYGQQTGLGKTPYGEWLQEFYDHRYGSGQRPVELDFIHYKPNGGEIRYLNHIDHSVWRSWGWSRRAYAYDRFVIGM